MTQRSVTHATFVVERTYAAPPARVFAAWADPAARARWSLCHDGQETAFDFRVGGREVSRGGPPGGPVYTANICFHDIVPEQRIVFSIDMLCDEARTSVSLATVEFKPAGSGTRLIFTEQGAFLDGHTPDQHENGTREGLERLAEELEREPVSV